MKHDFLRYEHAEIFFTYGFLWRSEPVNNSAAIFSRGLSGPTDGWRTPYVHERIIGGLREDATERLWIGSYQPSFVLEKRCLEWTEDLGQDLALAAPMARDIKLPQANNIPKAPEFLQDLAVIPVQGAATIRLFDNGSGVVTLRIQPQINSIKTLGKRFEALHLTLRLSPNMDLVPEEHEEEYHEVARSLPICDSFLVLPGVGSTRLFRVMEDVRRRALESLPPKLFGHTKLSIVPEQRGFAYEDSFYKSETLEELPVIDQYCSQAWQENQAPFTFVVCVVDEESSRRLHEGSLGIAQELGSVYARLTIDNRYISQDFLRLSQEYLENSLGYDRDRKKLPNHGHDDRLFFSFSRRGAIAVTSKVEAVPNVFVVPSLLNLFEIIRARLTSGVLVGSQLASLAQQLSELDISSDGPHTSEELFAYLRRLVVQNQQSPLEHLFDGGTATELALVAEEELLANRVWRNVQDSFEAVDRLRSAWLNKRFRAKYGE